MAEKNRKSKIQLDYEQKLAELTNDLQRTRADFENYRKRVDQEKAMAKESGQTSAILKLIPIIDNIDRAISFVPEELKDNAWAQGIVGLNKNLEKSLSDLNIKKIDASVGTVFNPEIHHAIQFDEEATGDNEVIAEELQSGYLFNDTPIRHAMVKVTRQ